MAYSGWISSPSLKCRLWVPLPSAAPRPLRAAVATSSFSVIGLKRWIDCLRSRAPRKSSCFASRSAFTMPPCSGIDSRMRTSSMPIAAAVTSMSTPRCAHVVDELLGSRHVREIQKLVDCTLARRAVGIGHDLESGHRLQLELRDRDVDAARREVAVLEVLRDRAGAPARAREAFEARLERMHFIVAAAGD